MTTWKNREPRPLSGRQCPVHGFYFVPMPRDADAKHDDYGYQEKCPLSTCPMGVMTEEIR